MAQMIGTPSIGVPMDESFCLGTFKYVACSEPRQLAQLKLVENEGWEGVLERGKVRLKG